MEKFYTTVITARCPKSKFQWIMMTTSSNGNIFRIVDPLGGGGESTGHRLFTLTEACDVEICCFILSVPEQSRRWWFETPLRTVISHLLYKFNQKRMAIYSTYWCNERNVIIQHFVKRGNMRHASHIRTLLKLIIRNRLNMQGCHKISISLFVGSELKYVTETRIFHEIM